MTAEDERRPANRAQPGTPGGSPARRAPRGRPTGLRSGRRAGRRLALAAIFEAEFGQRTATRALERELEAGNPGAEAAAHARALVAAVHEHREEIDALLEELAPAYRVVQLARIDRGLLRLGVGELLHCPTTPAGVAISEWVELARIYSGEPARRLLNGVLGRIAAGGDMARGRVEPTPQDGADRPHRREHP